MSTDGTHEEPLEGEIVDEGHDPGFEPGGPGATGPGDPDYGAARVTFADSGGSGAGSGGGAGGRSGNDGARGQVANRDRGPLAIGAVILTVGVVLLAYQFNDTLAAGNAPLVIGLAFIVWWAVSGNFGLVVPGGVLGGIGLGMILEQAGFYGEAVALGLGVGFLAIYVMDALRRRRWSRWWPLVPGVVLVVVGLFSNTSAWGRVGQYGWPLVLIVVGVIVVAVALSRRGPRR
jgi:hypothetical protein